MDILLQAVQAVQRNVTAFGFYLLFTVPAGMLILAGNAWMGPIEPDAPVTGGMLAYELLGDVFLVAVYAAAQSIAFSRMGRLLDRPLWKCATDREALKRYFPLWALLNVVAIASQRLVMWVPALMENEAAGMPLFWFMAVVMAVYLPLGTAIMFIGRPDWRRLNEAFAPLARQWPKTLSVCLFNAVVYFLLMAFVWQTESQRWLQPALDIAAGYFDCVIFCATWLICMFDRQQPQDDDLDYF